MKFHVARHLLHQKGSASGSHIYFPKFLNFFLLGTSGSRKKSPAPSSRRGSLRRPSLFDEGGDEPTGISLLNRRDPSPRAPSPSMKLRRGRPSLGGRTLTTVSCNFELLQVSYFLEILRIHLGILKIDHSWNLRVKKFEKEIVVFFNSSNKTDEISQTYVLASKK